MSLLSEQHAMTHSRPLTFCLSEILSAHRRLQNMKRWWPKAHQGFLNDVRDLAPLEKDRMTPHDAWILLGDVLGTQALRAGIQGEDALCVDLLDLALSEGVQAFPPTSGMAGLDTMSLERLAKRGVNLEVQWLQSKQHLAHSVLVSGHPVACELMKRLHPKKNPTFVYWECLSQNHAPSLDLPPEPMGEHGVTLVEQAGAKILKTGSPSRFFNWMMSLPVDWRLLAVLMKTKANVEILRHNECVPEDLRILVEELETQHQKLVRKRRLESAMSNREILQHHGDTRPDWNRIFPKP